MFPNMQAVPPRLLCLSAAAAYAGIRSTARFRTICPVRPVALGNDARLLRYDRHELDAWIDGIRIGADASPQDWLSRLDAAHDRRSR